MWLLSTDRAVLKYFNGPEDVKGGYAILSHVWKKHEQSFQEVQGLLYQDGIPRARTSAKLRECCVLAEGHGYQWIWIDTCCIDKTSSAELSEAINSMFEWYARAQVCYVFLHDVPKHERPDAPGSAFRRSEWFTRGWTLQELLAPDSVVFLSKTWTVLGTKASLARVLEEVSGIDADVLTFRRKLSDVSVARRMSWAAGRRTTRIEDEAYALMGLFGVNMPTIYGEGRRAFQRLQEEIIKQSSDQTIFAWGDAVPFSSLPLETRDTPSFRTRDPDSYLLASSPAAFANSADIVPVSMDVAAHTASNLCRGGKLRTMQSFVRERLGHAATSRMHVPEFTVTSHGVRCRLLIIEDRTGASSFSAAVLACQHVCSDTGARTGIALVLRRSDAPASSSTAKSSVQYHTGLPLNLNAEDRRHHRRQRLLTLNPGPHELPYGHTKRLTVRWRKLYLAQQPLAQDRLRLGVTVVQTIPLRFLFPAWLLVELDKRGFRSQHAPAPAPVVEKGAGSVGGLRTPVLYTRWHMRSVVFANAATGEAFAIQLGRCEDALWATVSFTPALSCSSTFGGSGVDEQEEEAYPLEVHQYTSPDECERHHITCWPDGSKTFGDAERSVRLTFSRRQQEPDDLYVVDIHLAGRVYSRVRRVGRVFLEGGDCEPNPVVDLAGVIR
ncbi:heterokaryon incompatibility protein-domain-containing protein [Lenzites betulinus]|nr:heterokaryon incompatibility protein-domain-containing protein [Lenzites betulinus]